MFANAVFGIKTIALEQSTLKNFRDQIIAITHSEVNGQEIENFYLVYVAYDSQDRLIKFDKPLLIAKDMFVKEKNREYHYNIAYSKPMTWYDTYTYQPNKSITESVINSL